MHIPRLRAPSKCQGKLFALVGPRTRHRSEALGWARTRHRSESLGRVTALSWHPSMPKRRGERCALRRAAETMNRNPPAPAPLPGWLTHLMDRVSRSRDLLELEAILRHLERLLQFVRDRLKELEAAGAEPAYSRARQG